MFKQFCLIISQFWRDTEYSRNRKLGFHISGVPKVCSSSFTTFCHAVLHLQSRSLKMAKSWVRSWLLIAFAMAASHSPQLCGPRLLPAPTGSQMMGEVTFFSTSTADHSQGGLYSPRFQRRSTSVLRWILHRLSERMSA